MRQDSRAYYVVSVFHNGREHVTATDRISAIAARLQKHSPVHLRVFDIWILRKRAANFVILLDDVDISVWRLVMEKHEYRAIAKTAASVRDRTILADPTGHFAQS